MSPIERFVAGSTNWVVRQTRPTGIAGTGKISWYHTKTGETLETPNGEIITLLQRFDQVTDDLLKITSPLRDDGSLTPLVPLVDKKIAKESLRLFFMAVGVGTVRKPLWEEMAKYWVPVPPPSARNRKVRDAERGSTPEWFPLDFRAFSFKNMTGGERRQCYQEFTGQMEKLFREEKKRNDITWRKAARENLTEFILKRPPFVSYWDVAKHYQGRKDGWWIGLSHHERLKVFDDCYHSVYGDICSRGRDRGEWPNKLIRSHEGFYKIDWNTIPAPSIANLFEPWCYEPLVNWNLITFLLQLLPDISQFKPKAFIVAISELQKQPKALAAVIEYEELHRRGIRRMDATRDLEASNSLFDTMAASYSPSLAVDWLLGADELALTSIYVILTILGTREALFGRVAAKDMAVGDAVSSLQDVLCRSGASRMETFVAEIWEDRGMEPMDLERQFRLEGSDSTGRSLVKNASEALKRRNEQSEELNRMVAALQPGSMFIGTPEEGACNELTLRASHNYLQLVGSPVNPGALLTPTRSNSADDNSSSPKSLGKRRRDNGRSGWERRRWREEECSSMDGSGRD